MRVPSVVALVERRNVGGNHLLLTLAQETGSKMTGNKQSGCQLH